MTHRRRLELLEAATAVNVSTDPTLCYYCQLRYHQAYQYDRELERLILGAEGSLEPWEMTADQARATMRAMISVPAAVNHCTRCGELTIVGWLREHRAELGLA